MPRQPKTEVAPSTRVLRKRRETVTTETIGGTDGGEIGGVDGVVVKKRKIEVETEVKIERAGSRPHPSSSHTVIDTVSHAVAVKTEPINRQIKTKSPSSPASNLTSSQAAKTEKKASTSTTKDDKLNTCPAFAAEAAVEEKRTARFRTKCPVAIIERMQRVMSQRMFLIDRTDVVAEEYMTMFRVAGSTGNVYSISVGPVISCDCPDFRKGNAPCKHIIFVFLKVLKVPQSSNLWYQKALLKSELKEVFDNAPPAPSAVMVPGAARRAMQRATGEEVDPESEASQPEDNEGKRLDAIGDDCPICFEEMSQADNDGGKLTFDRTPGGCGRPMHAECFKMWAGSAAARGTEVTCVYCRSKWVVANQPNTTAPVVHSSEGYLNMADVLGISRKRDTSTYYRGPIRGRHWTKWDRDHRYDDDWGDDDFSGFGGWYD